MDNLLVFNHSVICFNSAFNLLHTVFMFWFEYKRNLPTLHILCSLLLWKVTLKLLRLLRLILYTLNYTSNTLILNSLQKNPFTILSTSSYSMLNRVFSSKTKLLIKAWFPQRRCAPSPTFVAGDKFGGNYWRFVAQPSSLAVIRAMNIKKFWYSSPKFIARPHELSFMLEKMERLSMLQVIFVYIFITWNNIFR